MTFAVEAVMQHEEQTACIKVNMSSLQSYKHLPNANAGLSQQYKQQ